MKRSNFHLSLGIKLILSYLLIIVIPIIIFAVVEFRNFEAQNIKDVMSKSKFALDLEVVNITKKKETIESTAQMIMSNSELMNYINNFDKLDVRSLVQFNQSTYRNIMQLQYSNPSISGINIFLKNKNITEIWPLIISDKRVQDKNWFHQIQKLNYNDYWDMNLKNGSYFNIQYETSLHSDPVVALCRTIHYTKNKILGVLRVNMLSKDFFSKAYEDVNDTGNQMYIVDRSNNIYSNDKSTFSQIVGIDKKFILEKFNDNLRKSTNNFTINENGKHLIVIYKKLNFMNCYLLNVTTIDSMQKYISQARNNSILGILFLISIVFGLTYFTTMKILKKLYLIIQSMKKIQKGDFDIDIPVRGNDEIGELAHHFRKMLRKIDELITEAAGKKTTNKEAELSALKTQIDSHFIYNVIENIKMMAEIDGKYEISDSLTALGAMMRYNLKWKSEFVSLSDEIEHIKNYIALINIRFENKIKLNIKVEQELYKHEILKISLQPLVENAVKHGFIDVIAEREGIIDIKVVREEKAIKISIKDNGIGIEPDILENLNKSISEESVPKEEKENHIITDRTDSTGIGLRNVNERLRLYYGNDSNIKIYSEKYTHTTIIMTIPY